MKTPVSYYDILQISPSATEDDIRRAYLTLAKRFHPDNNPRSKRLSELKLKAINEAYATLGNQQKRATYNLDKKISFLQAQANNNNHALTSGILSRMAKLFSMNVEDVNRVE